jgi:hypothetical protein
MEAAKGHAGRGNRTPDPRITNALLYQLSYSGMGGPASLRAPPQVRNAKAGVTDAAPNSAFAASSCVCARHKA